MSHIVVIGAGQAALSFVAKLRALDPNTPVTLIGDEPEIPYQRPPLSKKFATGEMTREQLFLRPESWYDDQNIDLKLNTSVTKIDREAQMVTLSDQSTLSYTKLMIATGSRVRMLPSAVTHDLEGLYYLRSLADAQSFGAAMEQAKKVLIVGGGYIGLEAAAVCRAQGMDVTIVEASERILQRVACAQTSDWFRELHQAEGVKIIEGVGLSHFEGERAVNGAILSDGRKLEIDMAIIGIGIVPNAELATQAGLETAHGGILVDAFCQTSDPNIYGAGDCCAFTYAGELTRLESVPNAIDQATIAAENIAGDTPKAYIAKPWFWSDQFDVKLQIAGLNRGYDHVVTREVEGARAAAHFYYSGEQLLAVDAMNAPRIYMICKKLIEAGKNITREQAADSQFDLKSLL